MRARASRYHRNGAGGAGGGKEQGCRELVLLGQVPGKRKEHKGRGELRRGLRNIKSAQSARLGRERIRSEVE